MTEPFNVKRARTTAPHGLAASRCGNATGIAGGLHGKFC
jgi:hypothetical protein